MQHPTSPLDQLFALIEVAKEPSPVVAAPRAFDNPVEQIQRWVEVSGALSVVRDVANEFMWPEAWRQLLERAKQWMPVTTTPVRPATMDPLVFLSAEVRKEVAEVGGYATLRRQVAPVRTVVSNAPSVEPVIPAATLPDELLASFGRRDLPGAARAEAIALVVSAIESPSPEALRAILDCLVHG